jgi:hypothetical protein
LAGQVVLAAQLVDPRVVVAGAEVVVAGVRVGQQVPDDREDTVADRDDGPFLAASAGQTAVAVAEEGVGAGQPGDDLTECPGEPWVAFAGGRGLGAAGGLFVDRGELGPGHQMRRGGEHGHRHTDLGDEFLRRALSDAGDLIELVHGVDERGDQVVDARVQGGDVRGEGIDAVQHGRAEEAVVVVEAAGSTPGAAGAA